MGFLRILKGLLRFVHRSFSVRFEKSGLSLNSLFESIKPSLVNTNRQDEFVQPDEDVNKSSTQSQKQLSLTQSTTPNLLSCKGEYEDGVAESIPAIKRIIGHPFEIPHSLHTSSLNISGVDQMINFDGKIIDIVPTHREPVSFSEHEFYFYQELDARLKSFNGWPEDAAVSAEKVAEAGFFYQGKIISSM